MTVSKSVPATGPHAPDQVRGAGRAGFTALCLVQGLYFGVSGVWPLVSIDTFMAVTGPKTDVWLVQTVGTLIAVIAVVLLWAAWRRRAPAEVALLGLGSAAALAAVDVIFHFKAGIAPVYLLDAAAEGVLILAWVVVLLLPRGRATAP